MLSTILLRRTAATAGRTAAPPSRITRRWMGGGDGHHGVPVPQSQHAPLWHGHSVQTEGWEASMYFYAIVSIILQAAVVMGAPETSIESWARPEAQARLKLAEEGFTDFEFGKHYQDIQKKASLDAYDKFANRAVVPGEDDDDDDEEEEEEEEVCGYPHVYGYIIPFLLTALLFLICRTRNKGYLVGGGT